ncbi:hypothetical protein [Mycobacterium sp.]|uniref:hypothetical protein n=1 Tax=Mycobacterium sp. TaxID=1785 RepID=UPI0031CDD399
MRTDTDTVTGAVGGAVAGYLGWLVAISVGAAVTTVSRWSPIVLAVSLVLGLGAASWGWLLRRRRRYPLASFAFALPVAPVLLTLGVLADLYL